MNHTKFSKELETITNDDIKQFAEVLLDDAPDYFFHVAASSTGKYHPKYALGDGGLLRHTKAVVRMYNHLMCLEQYNSLFTDREIDLGRVACLAHDLLKQGTQDIWKQKSDTGEKVYTVFDHPLLAAKNIMNYKNKYLSEEELKFIASAVGTHMGHWNTNKHEPDIILPKPKTEMQKLVHLSDYLASRKDIDVSFYEDEEAYELPDASDYVLTFGKHAGKKLSEIPINYIKWLLGTDVKEPLKSMLQEVLDNQEE